MLAGQHICTQLSEDRGLDPCKRSRTEHCEHSTTKSPQNWTYGPATARGSVDCTEADSLLSCVKDKQDKLSSLYLFSATGQCLMLLDDTQTKISIPPTEAPVMTPKGIDFSSLAKQQHKHCAWSAAPAACTDHGYKSLSCQLLS